MTGARAATLSDVEDVADVLVRAFEDDPLMMYLFKTAEGRRAKSRLFFVSDARRAIEKAKGRVETNDDGETKGGAIWFAPDQWRTGGTELLGQIPMLFRMGRETPRALTVLSLVEPQQHRDLARIHAAVNVAAASSTVRPGHPAIRETVAPAR